MISTGFFGCLSVFTNNSTLDNSSNTSPSRVHRIDVVNRLSSLILSIISNRARTISRPSEPASKALYSGNSTFIKVKYRFGVSSPIIPAPTYEVRFLAIYGLTLSKASGCRTKIFEKHITWSRILAAILVLFSHYANS